MSRSGVFYAVKAMERTAAGDAAAGPPGTIARQAVDRTATGRPDGGVSSRIQHVLAIMRPGSGASSAGRGRRRLRGATRVG
jgi:hypothetical protein